MRRMTYADAFLIAHSVVRNVRSRGELFREGVERAAALSAVANQDRASQYEAMITVIQEHIIPAQRFDDPCDEFRVAA